MRYRYRLNSRFTPFLAALFVLSGCAATQSVKAPDGVFTTPAGEVSYHTLMAELALQRDQQDIAVDEYLAAARLTSDAEIAGRATAVAYQLGRDDAALEAATRWSALSPESFDPHRYLASLHLRRGDVEKSTESILFLIETVGDDEQPDIAAVTSFLVDEDRQDTAIGVMQRVVERYPDNPQAHYGLAMIALRAGDAAIAQAAARQAQELRPEWVEAALLEARALIVGGDTESGLELARQLIEREPTPDTRLEYALLLAGTGNDVEARDELEKVLRESPGMADALMSLGMLELRTRRFDEAERRFTELLATGRRPFDAIYYLATVAELKRDYTRALELYARVATGAHYVDATIARSRMLFRLGKADEALRRLDEFSEAAPRARVQATLAAGQILAELERYDEAFLRYDAELERDPDNDDIRYARAFLLEETGQISRAVDELRRMVLKDPEDPTALNALGYTLADNGLELDEAERLIAEALERSPDDAAVIDSMGWVLFRLGQYDNALRYLELAFDKLDDPEIAAHLGEVHWMLGNTERAREIWSDALRKNPDSRVLNDVIERLDP